MTTLAYDAILAPFNDMYPKPENPEFDLMSITERMVYMTREKITDVYTNCEFYCSVENVAEAMLAAARINESLLPSCKETYENPPIPVGFCDEDMWRRELQWEVHPVYDVGLTDPNQRVAFCSLNGNWDEHANWHHPVLDRTQSLESLCKS